MIHGPGKCLIKGCATLMNVKGKDKTPRKGGYVSLVGWRTSTRMRKEPGEKRRDGQDQVLRTAIRLFKSTKAHQ